MLGSLWDIQMLAILAVQWMSFSLCLPLVWITEEMLHSSSLLSREKIYMSITRLSIVFQCFLSEGKKGCVERHGCLWTPLSRFWPV